MTMSPRESRFREEVAGSFPGLLVLLLLVASIARPAPGSDLPSDGETDRARLLSMSLEQLMDVEILSASKKLEPVTEAAAAVFVITREDIRRSGATSVADALRLAPGMQVARIDVHQWAISARGFNSAVADKLLVMIDGRTVYSPLFSGVFWDLQQPLLEDVDRIEVIRGPGAALWGSNAVNGVINIITRPAKETPGGYATLVTGTLEEAHGSFRWGGRIGEDADYRVFADYFQRSELPSLVELEGASDWSSGRGGFRLDTEELTVLGEVFEGSLEEPVNGSGLYRDYQGGHLLARWSRETPERGGLMAQLYVDRADFDSGFGGYAHDTVDLELQHRLEAGARTELLWGLGYRSNADDVTNSVNLSVDPVSRRTELWSAFLQGSLSSLSERFVLTLGSKLEHNDFTGFEVQPTLRARWQPNERTNLWAAISRALQIPVRATTEVRFNQFSGPLPQPIPLPDGSTIDSFLVALLPNPDIEAEELIAYEAGLRLAPRPSLFLDLAIFFNDYDRLKSITTLDPRLEFEPAPPHVLNAVQTVNGLQGETYGLEVVADWTPSPRWRLQGWYSYLEMELEAVAGFPESAARLKEGQSPRHQASLRASWTPGSRWSGDAWLRFVDELPSLEVDSYLTLDLRVAWQASDSLELFLVGQNLLEDRHTEYFEPLVPGVPSAVERSVHGGVAWRF